MTKINSDFIKIKNVTFFVTKISHIFVTKIVTKIIYKNIQLTIELMDSRSWSKDKARKRRNLQLKCDKRDGKVKLKKCRMVYDFGDEKDDPMVYVALCLNFSFYCVI